MGGGRARVLVSTFGSAGDLFPLVPVVRALRDRGHDVRWAVPRAQGLYLRALRLPMFALGSGEEMRVMEDPHVVTTRFGGWASWRRTMTDYVLPTLRADVGVLERVFRDWRPDVVVTMSFAVAARVAADRQGIPHLNLSIYPQQVYGMSQNGSLAWPVRAAAAELLAEVDGRAPSPEELSEIVWGAGSSSVLLHDQVVLGPTAGSGPEIVGFPYWDAAPWEPDDLRLVERWVGRSRQPVVLVTLGSFLGLHRRRLWLEVVKAGVARGVRMVVVGPRRLGDAAVLEGQADVLRVGYLPTSEVAERVDVVVHHGGVGTMFGVLRAGRPAVVMPLAFDQSFNAGLLEAAGGGVNGPRSSLGDAIERALSDRRVARSAQVLGACLVSSDVATTRVVERILERVGQGA